MYRPRERPQDNSADGLADGLVPGVGYLIGGANAMVYAFLFGGLMGDVAFFFSDKIALATMRARQIGPDDDPTLWGIVEQLSQRAGPADAPRVHLCAGGGSQHIATGRSPRWHGVRDDRLASRILLSDRELRGVLGHELARQEPATS